jgi:segregation and condensation protein B
MEEHMMQDEKKTLTDEPQTPVEEGHEATDETAEAPEATEVEEQQGVIDEPDDDRELDEVMEPEDAEYEESESFEDEPVAEIGAASGEDEGTEEEVEATESEPAAEATIEVEFSVEAIGDTDDRSDEDQDQGADIQASDAEGETTESETEPQEDREPAPTVESVIEAILFASEEPLTEGRLAGIVETTTKQVRDCIQSLNDKYEQNHNAFRIEQIAGGHQMLTLSTYNTWLRKMLKVRSDNKLSPAAMETLAIIAYKQPVIRVDIEAIRGVAVGEVIRSLMYKGLVKIVGRAEILGRPMLYGTTRKFLEVFGLNSLKDLPKAEELKKPD